MNLEFHTIACGGGVVRWLRLLTAHVLQLTVDVLPLPQLEHTIGLATTLWILPLENMGHLIPEADGFPRACTALQSGADQMT